MATYRIVRFYQDDRPTKVIKTGLTLETAQQHCNRDDTRGTGWFDGYTEEDSEMKPDWNDPAFDVEDYFDQLIHQDLANGES